MDEFLFIFHSEAGFICKRAVVMTFDQDQFTMSVAGYVLNYSMCTVLCGILYITHTYVYLITALTLHYVPTVEPLYQHYSMYYYYVTTVLTPLNTI